ncbi:MAG: glucose-6-phosphate dehydrogenase, partial [Limisphaerales bacterium]
MDALEQLDELLTCRLDLRRKSVEPCTIVIFGASGDLTARKLIPALYHLFCHKQLPTPFRIIGFARRPKPDEDWRNELGEDLQKFSRNKDLDCSKWAEFAKNVFYCQGEFSDANAFENLKKQL